MDKTKFIKEFDSATGKRLCDVFKRTYIDWCIILPAGEIYFLPYKTKSLYTKEHLELAIKEVNKGDSYLRVR
jgi:hypothetical protein